MMVEASCHWLHAGSQNTEPCMPNLSKTLHFTPCCQIILIVASKALLKVADVHNT